MPDRRTVVAALASVPLVSLVARAQAQGTQTQETQAVPNQRPRWAGASSGKARVLLTGLDPSIVDYTGLPDLNPDKLRGILEAQKQQLISLGYEAQWCLIDPGRSAELKVVEALKAARFDAVLIGAGVRLPPNNLLLFERMVNAVHQYGFGARIVFNNTANDTADSVKRWA